MTGTRDRPPLRVLATRPAAHNAGWCRLLEKAGLKALPLPVLAIKPVQEPERRQAIKSLILNFDQFDKVIFVSQNAVREAVAWLDEYWPQMPLGMEYFAIGEKTAGLLAEHGLRARACSGAMDSDDLLAMPELQQVRGQKILICRGRGGRARLMQVLGSRGAQVFPAEFYERVLPAAAAETLRHSDFMRGGYREILSAFSGESLDNLVQVLRASGREGWHSSPILVPGERVAYRARQLGFGEVIAARNATGAAMMRALREWRETSERAAHGTDSAG